MCVRCVTKDKNTNYSKNALKIALSNCQSGRLTGGEAGLGVARAPQRQKGTNSVH